LSSAISKETSFLPLIFLVTLESIEFEFFELEFAELVLPELLFERRKNDSFFTAAI
jgi:hypothetical protein